MSRDGRGGAFSSGAGMKIRGAGVVAHFSKFSMHAWEKNPKFLVFARVYVCVKAKPNSC